MQIIHRDRVGWAISWSIALIVIGILALFLPLIAGVAISLVVAWLLLVGGVVHLAFAFHSKQAGGVAWQVLVGLLYLAAGVWLFIHPLAGSVGLTLVLGGYLMFKGLFEFILAAQLRGAPGGGWMILDGVISVILAIFIWRAASTSAPWILGTLAGIAIVFSGFSRLALSLSARRAHVAVA